MFKFIFLNTKKIPNIQDIYKRFKKLISDVSTNDLTLISKCALSIWLRFTRIFILQIIFKLAVNIPERIRFEENGEIFQRYE